MKKIKTSKKINKTQDLQDEIFNRMSADKKIAISLQLAKFCLKLNNFNGNYRPRKTSS
ncbi:MAG: hypothetical protein Q8N90_02385 [bacterium]|nr:hypothetical protein [bacterium]